MSRTKRAQPRPEVRNDDHFKDKSPYTSYEITDKMLGPAMGAALVMSDAADKNRKSIAKRKAERAHDHLLKAAAYLDDARELIEGWTLLPKTTTIRRNGPRASCSRGGDLGGARRS